MGKADATGRSGTATLSCGGRVLENEWITLHDGTRLAARIWLPAETATAPVPAVLEYIPYKKRGGTDARDNQTYPLFTRCGYAGVRVDLRGNGESDGFMEDEYTPQELADGAEVIAWIARQDWCDGNVGMFGISWGGFNALQVAALRPPALRAIITVCSTDDRYADDIHYMGGCPLSENMTWSAQMMSHSSRPPDPELLGEEWRQRWLARLEAMPFLAANWLRHQRRNAFWKHGSVCEDYAAITVPVLAVGGWHDTYTNAIPRLLAGLNGRAKGIIGPWEHRYPHLANVGPTIDFPGLCMRWWDRWLKGADNGAENDPVLRAYLLKSAPPNAGNGHRDGLWISEDVWPPSQTTTRSLHLSDGGLEEQATAHDPITISTPQDLGLMSGNFCPGMRIDNELPGDQRRDDEKSVIFETDPLSADWCILGAPALEFRFTSNIPGAFIVARLCDVAPDGASVRVSKGALNLSHTDAGQAHQAPDEVRRAGMKLDNAGYIFAAGHRIRLALSTSYWPFVWPSASRAIVTVMPGTGTLTLPVLPLEKIQPLEFAPAPPPSGTGFDMLRIPEEKRTVSTDADGGVTFETMDDLGHARIRENGLEIAGTVRHSYRIKPDDPLSARAQADWMFETGRGDWRVNTRVSSAMTADAENFHLTAQLEAFEGGRSVFRRAWRETIGRDHA